MPALHPPHSRAAVHVSDERAPRLLAQGWTAAGGQTTPAGDHVCDVCGFAAKTAADLGAHRRRHEGG